MNRADFETIILFVSVLLVDLLVSDGTSHWLEGVMLGSLNGPFAVFLASCKLTDCPR